MISLYYAPDNASLIIRILLEEAGIAYKSILVERRQQAQKSSEYRELNPDGLIPVCIINNEPVFETAAIALSLADMHNQLHIPVADNRRPQFLKWLFFLSNSLHSDLRQRFYASTFVGEHQQARDTFNDITFKRLIKRLTIMETQYASTTNLYLFSSEPTIVDIYLAVCMRWCQLYPTASKGQIRSHDFPAIASMLDALQCREAVKAACAKEGISGAFFTDPSYAQPAEGTAV